MSPSVAQVMRFMGNFRKEDGSESEIETALSEALANAVIHGNGGTSCKRVYVDCRCYRGGEVWITGTATKGKGLTRTQYQIPLRPRIGC